MTFGEMVGVAAIASIATYVVGSIMGKQYEGKYLTKQEYVDAQYLEKSRDALLPVRDHPDTVEIMDRYETELYLLNLPHVSNKYAWINESD